MILFGEGGAEEALFETALMQQLVALASTQYMTVFALVTNDGSLLDDSEPLILTIVFWVLYPPLTTNMRHLVTQTDHERYAQCKQLEITDLVFAVLSALLSLINLRVGNHFLLIAYVAVAYYHRTVRPLGTPAFALAAYTVLLVPSDRYFPMAIYMIGAQSLTAYYNRLSRAVAGSENAIIVTRLTVAILVGRTLLFSEPYGTKL